MDSRSTFSLSPDHIILIIPTHSPAEDAARFMEAILKAIEGLQHVKDENHHDTIQSLLELYRKLNPPPDENTLRKRFGI